MTEPARILFAMFQGGGNIPLRPAEVRIRAFPGDAQLYESKK